MGDVLQFPATLNEPWFTTEPQLHVWDPDQLDDDAYGERGNTTTPVARYS